MIRAAVQFTSFSKCQRRLRTFGISSLPPIGTWYPNLSNVRIQDGSRELSQGVDFTGILSRYRVYSQFVPNEWLAWDARGTGLHAYHLANHSDTNGCCVLTEETQRVCSAFIQVVYAQPHE